MLIVCVCVFCHEQHVCVCVCDALYLRDLIGSRFIGEQLHKPCARSTGSAQEERVAILNMNECYRYIWCTRLQF